MKKLLVIGHTFPEPTTTAAGVRMMQLIQLFIEEEYHITFGSTATRSERSVNLELMGITVESIRLNDSTFDEFILRLNPSVVIFDRYITEEQFGWRVAAECPDALRILDTEDLHFLRMAREEAIKNNRPLSAANLYSEIAKRELASILRSDLSLIISDFELNLLKIQFQVSDEILHYLPFLVQKRPKIDENGQFFDKKANFLTIGNFLHSPNKDAIIYLKQEIWPLIKKQLPAAELLVYGAYAPQQIRELHNEKEGFLIKGWIDDLNELMQRSRICLAPIRFGAGLKGKIIDAMLNGLPVVTSRIGAEGITGDSPFPGAIEDDPIAFATASVRLYTDERAWQSAREIGFKIIEKRFHKDLFSEEFKTKITRLLKNLKQHREDHFIGQILQHHSLLSTKYMSKWIEAKKKE